MLQACKLCVRPIAWIVICTTDSTLFKRIVIDEGSLGTLPRWYSKSEVHIMKMLYIFKIWCGVVLWLRKTSSQTMV